jgi:2-polyprenyl-6-methoxyphenol hydroxylase-like FAD-dependent oxidoreductase
MQENPPIAILGAGIAGVALAIALQQHKIPCMLLEKDASFDERHQGYGLTMQQAGKALVSLGVSNAVSAASRTSRSHCIFHANDGRLILAWGHPIDTIGTTLDEASSAWTAGLCSHVTFY